MPALLLLILIPLYLLALMAILDALHATRKRKPAAAVYSPDALQSKITELRQAIPAAKPAAVKVLTYKALPAPKPITLLACPPFIFQGQFIECEVGSKDTNYYPEGSKIQIGAIYAKV